jgi:hypothetical protein
MVPRRKTTLHLPLLKLKGHARALKGLITDINPARPELDQLYVDAVVVLPAPNASLSDPSGKDGKATTTLARAERFFKDSTRLPNWANRDIRGSHRLVLNALQANSRPINGPKQFGDWTVLEDLGGSEDTYTDYRVYNTAAGPKSGTALLRAYRADPYLTDPEEIAQQQARIQNAYVALNRMSPTPTSWACAPSLPAKCRMSFTWSPTTFPATYSSSTSTSPTWPSPTTKNSKLPKTCSPPCTTPTAATLPTATSTPAPSWSAPTAKPT